VARTAFLLLAIAYAAAATSSQTAGEALFRDCEFKAAAHVFESALRDEPDNARFHFWLGNSYARMAEVASPCSAPRNARKARVHLEAAVRLDPKNGDFRNELFEFYVDSPEWFDGGLDHAAQMLEWFGPDDGGPGTRSRKLAESRSDHRGAGWGYRKGILRISAALGYAAPIR